MVAAVLALGLASAAPAGAAGVDGTAADGPTEPTAPDDPAVGAQLLDGTALAGARGRDLAAGRYVPRAVDLGVPGARSQALMVSETGVVVGSFQDLDGPRRTFRWRDGRLEVLSGVEDSVPLDVNAAGQVTIFGSGPWFRGQAFLWEPDGSLTRVVDSDAEVASVDVNDRGTVTFQLTHQFGQNAGRWVRGLPGEPDDIQVFYPDGAVENGVAGGESLNERGEILGWSLEADYATYSGWIWRDGVFTYLRAPGGVNPVAINERGQVLALVGEEADAVLYERDGRVRPLDPAGLAFSGSVLTDRGVAAGSAVPAGTTTRRAATADVRGVRFLRGFGSFPSAVRSLTNHGVAAGWAARDASGVPRAAAWVLGWPVALGDVVGGVPGVESRATGVNERGLVAGTVTTEVVDGQPAASRAVVWDLVPRW